MDELIPDTYYDDADVIGEQAENAHIEAMLKKRIAAWYRATDRVETVNPWEWPNGD